MAIMSQIGTPTLITAHTRTGLSRGFFGASAIVVAIALGGCGASSNSAPVVYGTEPAQGRIYNSPAEIYLERPAQRGVQTNSTILAQSTRGTAINSDPYSAPQGVRIYDRPPSAQASVVAQAPLPPAPNFTPTTTYVAPTQQSAYSDPYQPVGLSQSAPQQDTRSFQGLPPAPVYLTGERANNTASSPYGQARYSGQNGDLSQTPSSSFITVQPGDTVFAIARKTGFQPKDIIAANNLYAPYNLTIGQTLSLPAAQPSTTRYVDAYAGPSNVQASYEPVAAQSAQPAFREVISRDVLYTVQSGDTLYSIARRNNIGVQAITNANRLNSPFSLAVGQQLLLPAVPVGGVTQPRAQRTASAAPVYRPVAAPKSSPPAQRAPRQLAQPAAKKDIESLTRQASFSKPKTQQLGNNFDWPVKGSVVSNFGTGGVGRRNVGINIAAALGSPVRAAADGEVVYRGSELDGYGNLLLVKHEGGYVTVYAHNDAMVVRKGQKVRKGQIIAKVGKSGAVNEPQLHFEIRQNTKSLDPMQFLASN